MAGLDDDAVAGLIIEYLTWGEEGLRAEYGIEEPPADTSLVRSKLGDYRPPSGLLLLATFGDDPVGVGALRWLDNGVAEVKRMYVAPRCRGAHLGSTLLDRLLEEAALHNASVLRLDTVRFMTDAQNLYRSRGFVERKPYEGTEIPSHMQQHWLFFERRMSATPS